MPKRSAATIRRMLPWLSIAVVVIALDQLSKVQILRSVQPGERIVIVPDWFDLTLVFNRGAAFSFLADSSGWQRWFFIGIGTVATGYLLWLLARHGGQWLFSLGLALILGGAIGNVIDRLVHGYVVDMLDFHAAGWHFPAFNLADSAITLGAACLILDEVLRVRRGR